MKPGIKNNRFQLAQQAIILLSIFISVYIICAIPINSHDFWWHLNTGDYILEQTQLPGSEDPYTFSVINSDEYNTKRAEFINKQYWISQVIFSFANSAMGLQGIIYLRVALFSVIMFAAYFYVRKRTTILAACIFLPLFILTMAIVLEDTDRPQNFGFLYAFLTVMIVEFAIHKAKRNYLLLCLPVILLYANSHAGAAVSICYLGVYVFFSFFEKRLIPYRGVLAVCFALTFIAIGLNPNGYQVFTQILGTNQSYVASVTSEFRSPFSIFHPSLAYPGWTAFWILTLIAPLTAVYLLVKKEFSAAFILCATLVMALISMRYIFFFTPLAFYFTACFTGSFLDKRKPNITRHEGVAATFIIFTFALILFLSHQNMQFYSFNNGLPRTSPLIRQDIYPITATQFLKENDLGRNIFNLEAWGGYLEYHLYPQYRFFTDTRNLDENRIKQHFSILAYNQQGKKLLSEYNISTVIIPPIDYRSGAIYNIIREFYRSDEWQLIFYGKNAMVFSKDQRSTTISKSMIYLHVLSQLNYWGQIYPITPAYIKSLQEAKYFLARR
ncbi:MAG: hypothetical protein C0623_11960 [Desulfuromonas sp.]|nr:MAG: hypothetical protein C0623_11960 [Desulfuromonas sp.]